MIAIIMASGSSKRMNENKLLLKLDGIPLLEHAIRPIQNCRFNEIILIYKDEEVRQIGERYGLKMICNSKHALGQSESLKLGVIHGGACEDYMFFTGDMPFLKESTIRRLQTAFYRAGGIVVPNVGRSNKSPVIFANKYRDELLSLEGDEGGRRIIKNYPAEVAFEVFSDPLEFLDIDRVEDLKMVTDSMKKQGCRKTLRDLIVVVKGAGEMATGIAHRLYRSHIRNIVMTEVAEPVSVRRAVSFSEAVFDGKTEVEGVQAELARRINDVRDIWEKGRIAVIIDPQGAVVKNLEPDIVIDAIMAKKNLGTTKTEASLVVGIGPGFSAPAEVHAVVESKRGHHLGRVIHDGAAEPFDGIPAPTMGFTTERVLRSPHDGLVKHVKALGEEVKKGEIVLYVDETPICAAMDGLLRGLIREIEVRRNLKIGDIDPRGAVTYCSTIGERARGISGGVLEAIMHKFNNHCGG